MSETENKPGAILWVCRRLDSESVERLKPSSNTIVLDKWHGGATVFLDNEEDYAIRSQLEFEFRQAIRELETSVVSVLLVGHVGCKCARISRRVDMSHLSADQQAQTMLGMLLIARDEIRKVEETFPTSFMPDVELEIPQPVVIQT